MGGRLKIIAASIFAASAAAMAAQAATGGTISPGQPAQVAEGIPAGQGEVLLAQNATAPAVPSNLPGGASSLQETYEDWQVACMQRGEGKFCSMSQQQAQQNGQRILAIEINKIDTGKSEGILALPFGLALDSGVTVQVDEKPAGKPLRFRTCIPAGCLVPVSFDAAMVTALRGGTALKLAAVASENGQPVNFSISLKGFGAALDRTAALVK
ncbi:invasion associated locus B family protein [Mesorhizobium sp. DCY119]|uniref:invasion associated locus B family protein n=2 Tax=Mesorhizobium TaxID=68287 RepID=UPI0008E92988|nr:invasion associated locus B family protein [Mesorhizobium sp. DCY119]SFT80392.1 Invasion protein IalB, involved in pathogenesis [Mesorhizobium sp. YR577]